VVIALIAYYAGQRRPRPRAAITASHELTWANSHKLPTGFELKFLGRDIPHISRGLLRFWNAGSETLSKDLVPPQDKIRLCLTDGEFLLAGITRVSNPVNECRASIDVADPKAINFEFDFLDPGQGAVVGFLHTSSTAIPTLRGTIKGHKIQLVQSSDPTSRQSKFRRRFSSFERTFAWVSIVVGAISIALIALPNEYLLSWRVTSNRPISSDLLGAVLDKTFFAILGSTYLLLGAILLWRRRRRFPKSLEMIRQERTETALVEE